MVLSCPAAIVALFIVELNSTLYQGLPTDMSVIPLENHELVVSGAYPQGSTIASNFNNVHILHVQADPAYNPYFVLNNQSRTLHSKIAINPTQGNTSYIGTFLMAVNKQNQSNVNTLYCVTYCIGNLTELSIHEACYDSVSSGALHVTMNGSLLSQHVYESNISQHARVAYNVLQLSLTAGNKTNVSFAITECSSRLFFVDDQGVLRTGRQLLEEDIAIHVLKIAASAKISDVPQLELALATVKVVEANTFPPIFEQPDGYTFSVMEGEQGVSVGFVKAVDRDVGLSGKVVYSFEKQQDTSLFELNDTTGEIKTSVALDRETAESHMFTVVATDLGVPKSFNSQVEVRVVVEDINDNRPVFANKEAELVLSLYTQPGPILSLKAEDKDTGKNAKMAYTISQGNDRNLFWINSTSGELFLVAPLTVTANDSIVLVVNVVDIFSTNSSFQDTAVVRMTFYDVTSPSARGSSVAVISGVSVGGVLFITIIAAVSLWLWKRQKSKLDRRKYKALAVVNTDQTPFEYEQNIYTVGDTARRSSFEIYPPLKDAARSPGLPQDSQISLDLSAIEFELHPFSLVSQRPRFSHSEPSTPTKELKRSRGSHVSLDLTEIKSESLSAPPTPKRRTKEWRYRRGSHVSLDLSQVEPEFLSGQQAPKETSEKALSQTETPASTSKSSQVRLDLSCVEPDLAAGKYEPQSISQSWKQKSDSSVESEPSSSVPAYESTSTVAEELHVTLEVNSGDSQTQLLPERSPTASPPTKESISSISKSSQGSLDLIEMESDTKQKSSSSSLESELTFSPEPEDSRTSIVKSSQLSLDLDIVEPNIESTPTSPKQSIESSLSEGWPKPSSSAKESTSSIAETSQESKGETIIQFIPQSSIQKSESVLTASLQTQESEAIITESSKVSLELGGIEYGSQLTSQSSTEDSRTSSGGSKGDIDLTRDVASFSSCTGSWGSLQSNRSQGIQSKPSIELDTCQDSSEEYYSADEYLVRKSLRSSKPDTLDLKARGQPRVGRPCETVSLPIVIGNTENITREGDKQLPIQNLGQSISLPAIVYTSIEGPQTVRAEIRTQTEVELRPSTESLQSENLPKRSQVTRVSTETVSIPTTAGQSLCLPTMVSTAIEEPETVPHETSDQAGVELLPSGSFEDDFLPLHQRCIQDLEKSQSSYKKVQPVKSTKARIPLLGEVEYESQLTPQSSSEDSRTSSGGSKGDIDLTRDVASFASCTGSWGSLQSNSPPGFQSKRSIELDTHQDSSEDYFSADEYLRKSLRSSKPDTLEVIVKDRPHVHQTSSLGSSEKMPRETVSLPIVIGNTENVTREGDRQLPIQNLNQSISLPAMVYTSIEGPETVRTQIRTQAEVELRPSTESFQSRHLPHCSRVTQVSIPSTVGQSLCLPTVVSTAIEEPETVPHETSDQTGVEFLPSGSFEDDFLPLHQRSNQDLENSQSSYAKLQPVKSKIPRIPLKVKKAFKFLTSEKHHKRYSKFQQEGSSDDSDDATKEKEISTPRKRFPLFGRKKKKSSSRCQTSGHNSLPHAQTESGAMPVPSAQQENAPVITDQNVMTDQFPCSTGLETLKVTGADTLAEGSIDVANDNGENLEKTSCRLSKSGESVIRREDATIESKEIEEFEHEDNIDLSIRSFEYSAPVMDDSRNSFPEISCETEDIKGIEGDLQEQNLRSESVSRESVDEIVEPIKAGSFTLSPGQDSFTSSATPSFSQEASFSLTLPAVTDVLRTVEDTSFSGTRSIEDEIYTSSFATSNTESTLPTTLALESSESRDSTSLNVVGEDVSHVTQERDIPYPTNETGLEDGSVSSLHEEDHSRTFSLSPDNAVTTDSSTAMLRSVAETMLSEDVSEPQDDLGTSVCGRSRVSLGSVHGESQPPYPTERWSSQSDTDLELKEGFQNESKAGVTSTSYVPSESGMTNLSLHSSQSCQQEKLLKDIETELTPQAELSSSSSDASIKSNGSSREDVGPLRQSKPCAVLSDSNIQVCRESTSSTLAATTSSVSQPLPSRGSPLSLQSSVHEGTSTSSLSRKRSVESTAQSQTSDTDLSALHPPLETSGAGSLQHISPAWSRRDSVEQLSLDETHDNVADVSSSGLLSPEVSSPRAKRQETSHEDIGMLVSSMDSLLISGDKPHDEDTSSETDE